MAAAAAVLLTVRLRRRLGSAAWAYGLAAYAGLFFTAPATGEPDWWAAVVAVAAVGTALLARESTGGSMAGALLAVVALLKISSLPIALAAVMLIAAFDRRRALWALASAFVAGCLAVALIWWLAPYEIVWLLDIRAIQPAVWTAGTSAELREYLANLAARWPTVAVLPAFFVGASRREVIAVGGATGLAVLGFVAQGQYYVYHAVPLVVLSAVLAVHTVRRSGAVLRRPVLVGIVVVAMLVFGVRAVVAALRGEQVGPGHVVDVDVVAGVGPVAVHLGGRTGQHRLGEDGDHAGLAVRILPRAVHIGRRDVRAIQVVQIAEHVEVDLAGHLARRIR